MTHVCLPPPLGDVLNSRSIEGLSVWHQGSTSKSEAPQYMVIDYSCFLLGDLFHPPPLHLHSNSGDLVSLLSVTQCQIGSSPLRVSSEIHSSHAALCLPIVEA